MVQPPSDGGLHLLDSLFDPEWVWRTHSDQLGHPEEQPERLRIRQFSYQPGRRALVSYVAERQWEQFLVEEPFAIEVRQGREPICFRYPDDPYLPGLPQLASPVDAHDLIAKYLPIHPQRLRVEQVVYRPSTRAVLRHISGALHASSGEVTLYARVMPPRRLQRFYDAGVLANGSSFTVPRLVGFWPEGGAVWMTEVPGDTLRWHIREGSPADPEQVLDGLVSLWALPSPAAARPLSLGDGLNTTLVLFRQTLTDPAALEALEGLGASLQPRVEAWAPSGNAHNDFYDDQVIVGPDGRLALVDFEEIGPGDPMVDVANLLAHLRWMTHFNADDNCAAYARRVRAAALERFSWSEGELAWRESYSLLRLSTNPIRRLYMDWPAATHQGLRLAAEALETA